LAFLGGAADPLAVTDNDVAELALGIQFIEKAIRVAGPRHELVFHLNSGLGGEVFRELHQSVGRVPCRPAQRQLLCLGNRLTAKTGGDNDRGHPQCTHHLDHYNLPVLQAIACQSCQSHFALRRSCTQT
jgi:hypothetical protein